MIKHLEQPFCLFYKGDKRYSMRFMTIMKDRFLKLPSIAEILT